MKPRSEPVAIGAGVIAVIQALLLMLVALDIWSLSDVQTAAVMAFVTAVVALVGAVYVRRQVTPNAQAEAAVEAARTETEDDGPKHLAE